MTDSKALLLLDLECRVSVSEHDLQNEFSLLIIILVDSKLCSLSMSISLDDLCQLVAN